MADTQDQVTSGRNSLGLQERYGELVKRQGSPLAAVMLNLKGFRYLNLRYGRSAGDDILRVVGQGLDQLLQPGESWGRLAADQFCLLLQGGGQAEVEARIVTLDWALYDLPDPRINRLLCFSYGVYLAQGEAPDFYTALERADLCRVKSQHYPIRNSSYEFLSAMWIWSSLGRSVLPMTACCSLYPSASTSRVAALRTPSSLWIT